MKKTLYLLTLAVLLFGSRQGHAQIITTVAGNGIAGYTPNGSLATGAGSLEEPYDVALDDSNNIYIAEYGSATVRKVNKAGIISTVAGNGIFAYSGDGGPATSASIFEVLAIIFDHAGNLYIADGESNVIRKVNTAGIISTVAGNGTTGYSGDGGPADSASLDLPTALACDDSGNLYIVDLFNSAVRKVSTSGIITTVAGNGSMGYSGDGGPATAATLSQPNGITIDHSGNIYIADGANFVIRKVNTAGIISTYAGNGIPGYSGDGGPATSASLSQMQGLAIDDSGNLFIADQYNNVIRKVSAAGVITTVAGNGTGGYAGDLGLADSAELSDPTGIKVDAIGNLFIADYNNNTIREVSAIGAAYIHLCAGDSSAFNVAVTGGTWASSAPGIAYVSTSGMVTGVSAGSATIYYSIGIDTAATMVFVAATPFAGTLTGVDTVCIGTLDTLNGAVAGGSWSQSNTSNFFNGNVLDPEVPGSDTLTYTVVYSCGTATASFVVTDLSPAVGPISGTFTVCPGDTLTFTDTTMGGVWSIFDTTIATLIGPGEVRGIIPGFNEIEYTVNTSVPGCSSMVANFFQIDSLNQCGIAGVAKAPLTNDVLQVWPNPSAGNFNIHLPVTGQRSIITISDLYGRVVETREADANTSELEIKLNAAPGNYFLKVQNDNGSEVRQIVVE